MQKYFIIAIIVFIIINLILMIPIEVRIIKRIGKPVLIRIRMFNRDLYIHTLDKTTSKKKKGTIFKFKISYIFETDLNEILSSLKDDNFFVYLILEHSAIKKVTVIPTFNSDDPAVLPYLGVMNWFLVSNIKKYIDYTFKIVEDDYYQIVLLKEDLQGLNFEIYSTVTLFKLIVAIFSNFKVFLKLFKKKEKKNYEQ